MTDAARAETGKGRKKKGTDGVNGAPDSAMRKAPGYTNAVPGVNTPTVSLPAYNPPVPNRAWTEMRAGRDIQALSEEEKAQLYGKPDAQH